MRPTPATRRFVLAFLAAFAICGLAGVEAWPLTGWRLFSHLRHARQESWHATVIDAAGAESPVPFGALGAPYRGNVQVLIGFPRIPRERRLAVCGAWLDALEGRPGPAPREIRIYRLARDVSDRLGDRGAPPYRRTLRFTCTHDAVREVTP